MSQGVISSELILFDPKAVKEGVEYLQYVEYRPTNQITEDGSVDIHIKASGQQSGRGRCVYTCESVDAESV